MAIKALLPVFLWITTTGLLWHQLGWPIYCDLKQQFPPANPEHRSRSAGKKLWSKKREPGGNGKWFFTGFPSYGAICGVISRKWPETSRGHKEPVTRNMWKLYSCSFDHLTIAINVNDLTRMAKNRQFILKYHSITLFFLRDLTWHLKNWQLQRNNIQYCKFYSATFPP